MTDVVDKATRSRMMAGIRGKNTKPEMIVRKALHAQGFRFRLHAKKLPGKPDLVLPKYKAVIFVHGCFWHGHANCHYFHIPSTRPEFWREKIHDNQLRDDRNIGLLAMLGWKIMILWECSIRQTSTDPDHTILMKVIVDWLTESNDSMDVSYIRNKGITCSKI